MRFPIQLDHTDAWAWALPALLLLAFGLYAPGLSGNFLFDDHINLDRLGEFGGVDNWATAVAYLFGGHLQGVGRPISLASFLLNDFSWPSNPRGFIYTNVLFHLLSMTLVAALALQLARALSFSPARQNAVAVLAAAIWGLHPFLVSTVLYIVQRMTILSALFVILGLILYVLGRRHLHDGRTPSGLTWMTTGIVVFTPLAVLSKPNGALLPLLALVLEFTVLRGLGSGTMSRQSFRAWQGIFLWLPLVLVAGYFVYAWEDTIVRGYLREGLTLKLRLLTEPRVLFDYVTKLAIPRIQTSGLLHDYYHARMSTGLLSPPTTLFSLLGLLAAITAAISYRRRFPMVAAAVLFFLAGHIIESTFIPLEIYFEHRNYLPFVLPAIAIAVGLTALPLRRAVVGSVLIVSLLGSFTALRANLWGNSDRLLLTWAHEAPGSIRAAQYAALVYLDKGQPLKARRSIERTLEEYPNNGTLRLQYLVMLCVTGDMTPAAADRALEALRSEPLTPYMINTLEDLAREANGRCGEFDTRAFIEFLHRLHEQLGMKRSGGSGEDLGYLSGRLLLQRGDIEAAVAAFQRAVEVERSLPAAMRMAAELASAGAYDHALDMLDRAEQFLEEREENRVGGLDDLRKQLAGAAVDYRSEIDRLRRLIREEQASQ